MQEKVRRFNYHITIGGSVINKGHSYKDLDLYFLSMTNTGIATDSNGLEAFLQEQWGEPFNLGGPTVHEADLTTAYGVIESYYAGRYTYRPEGKRIDVFISE